MMGLLISYMYLQISMHMHVQVHLQSLYVWSELNLLILTTEDDVRRMGRMVAVKQHLPWEWSMQRKVDGWKGGGTATGRRALERRRDG